ncbi:mechanosensitive ion channel protein MscS [Formosimonas limnophila]|uniref:Mechanosensitive ion channel protein MscS n=1 Tax=Formosimonas limnophila TaxID=1384487 RepID=A0A8J3CGR7_9BURK|nr:mechanosensitive ion channel protein MscS [Formosimonas limnophila]
MIVSADNLEQSLIKQPPVVNGVSDLLAQTSVYDWVTTVAIILLAYGITWWVKRWLRQRDMQNTTPRWFDVNAMARVLFPLLLWLMAHGAQVAAESLGASDVWLKFITQLFGAFFAVRLFLSVVRGALPDGSVRDIIERVCVISIWAVVLLEYTGRLDSVLAHLDSVRFTLGKSTVTLSDVIALVFIVTVVWLLLKWLTGMVEAMLIQRPNQYFVQFDLSARVIFVRIAQGVLVVVAVLFCLMAVGIDVAVLSVFGGALGVGIGLGLQKIASNYVSGFVMLFERSVRIGDLITTTDNQRGYVTQINARYTVIQGMDGNEFLVPNERLITMPVTNWTLNDHRVWMSATLHLKHGVDIDFIRPKLIEAVSQIPRVLASPAPAVLLANTTNTGHVLEITWWVNDPENGRMNVTSDINLAIWRVCRAYDIPFSIDQAKYEAELAKAHDETD